MPIEGPARQIRSAAAAYPSESEPYEHAESNAEPPKRAGAEETKRLLEMIAILTPDLYSHGVSQYRSRQPMSLEAALKAARPNVGGSPWPICSSAHEARTQ